VSLGGIYDAVSLGGDMMPCHWVEIHDAVSLGEWFVMF
jgi:hypothetical protein